MFTLAASTVTQIVQKSEKDRLIRVTSDSTTMTRIASTIESLEGNGGEILTAYESKVFIVPAGTELHAISTATPNISATELSRTHASDEARPAKARILNPRD